MCQSRHTCLSLVSRLTYRYRMTGDVSGVETKHRVEDLSEDELIGERVHAVIWRRKMTQTEVAGWIDLTQSALSNKLRGKRPFLARELRVLARRLGVSTDFLSGLTDNPNPGTAEPGEDAAGTATSPLSGSNRRPFAYKASALPCDTTEVAAILPFPQRDTA